MLVIKVLGKDNDEVCFKIIQQIGRHASFANYRASNGICIESIDCPEWKENMRTLFVRGSQLRRDEEAVYCKDRDFPFILAAIEEYNQHYFPTPSHIVDSQLFEI